MTELCKNMSAGYKACKILCKQKWVLHSISDVLCSKLPEVINSFPLRINSILKENIKFIFFWTMLQIGLSSLKVNSVLAFSLALCPST